MFCLVFLNLSNLFPSFSLPPLSLASIPCSGSRASFHNGENGAGTAGGPSPGPSRPPDASDHLLAELNAMTEVRMRRVEGGVSIPHAVRVGVNVRLLPSLCLFMTSLDPPYIYILVYTLVPSSAHSPTFPCCLATL